MSGTVDETSAARSGYSAHLLDEHVLSTLRPVCLGLAPLYLLFTVSHFFLLEPSLKPVLVSLALLSAVVFLLGYILLGRFKPPLRYANACAAAMVSVPLLNSLLHLGLSAQPEQSTNLALIIIGAGVLLMSRFWFAAFTGVTLAGWLGLMLLSGDPASWIHYAFLLVGATVVGALTFRVHRKTYLKLASSLHQGEQLIDTLETQKEALEASNKELEQFAYIASHDLQEPLRKIQAFGSRLARKHGAAIGKDGLYSLTRMQDSAARMQTLIQALLGYSRVDSSPKTFSEVDLNQVVADVAADLENLLERSQGQVIASPLPTVSGDAVQLRQLVQNLVSNGLKFARADVPPVVSISAEQNDNELRVIVQDNGAGFDAHYAEKIFGIFQRLHKRSEVEGTGIGLAVVRKIAERHGGTVSADGVPGEGATFTVTLPATTLKRAA